MYANLLLRLFVAGTLILAVCIAEPVLAKKGGKGSGGGTGTTYRIIALDDWTGAVHNGEARDINNLSEVVGFVDDAIAGSGRYAAYWSLGQSNGQPVSVLSMLSGGNSATGINDSGEIVGSGDDANGNPVGLYWNAATSLPIELPPLNGHDASVAHAINSDGVICGVSGVLGGVYQPSAVAWRVYWMNGTPTMVGPLELPGSSTSGTPLAINDSDANGVAEIAGASGQDAVVWTVQILGDGSLSVGPAPVILDADAEATGINNSGVACGQRGSLAVSWEGVVSSTLKRPTKGKNAVSWTVALDISDTGVIVGRGGPGLIDARAVVWADSGSSMQYLDQFLGSNSPLIGLGSAEAVNDNGVIVGRAWNGAYLAAPN